MKFSTYRDNMVMKPKRSPSVVLEQLEERQLLTTYFVATNGSNTNPGSLAKPFQTIQYALNAASHPGDVVEVHGGTYHERLTMPHSGSSAASITLEAYPGQHVLLSGSGANNNDVGFGDNMIQIINQSYLQVIGFEIAYDSGAAIGDDAIGIRVQGSGSNIVLKNNSIHDIDGKVLSSSGGVNNGYAGAGIQVYGSSLKTPWSNVIITGNTIYNCQPGDSETETLTVNGNIDNFQITDNTIHNCNNIGIGMIGGEADAFNLPSGTQNLPGARNGLCSHNTVYNIHANYGGGYADGIYIDGGQDITVSDNTSYSNDLGIEVGCENAGYVASGNVVESNLIYRNTQGGLLIGGYDSSVGRVANCRLINNTVYDNDTTNTGSGQLLIQYASNNVITNNVFDAVGNEVLIGSAGAGNSGNTLDHNLYWAANVEFDWNADSYSSLSDFQNGTGEDHHSIFADPKFANAGANNFTLASGSPAHASGSSTSGQYDPDNFLSAVRALPPNIGAY